MAREGPNPREPGARAGLLVVAALAVAAALLARDHARTDSATMDEPFHALASAEYVRSGTFWANLEHPPLAKLLAGASMAFSGVRAPLIPRPFSFAGAESPLHFVFANVVSADDLLCAARRPFPWLLALVVAAAAAGARREAGVLAGVFSAAFLAFEPNLVAHAGLLHTDVAASLGLLATVLLAVRAAESGRLRPWAAAGCAWGLSMAAKFSLVYAGPFLLLVVLLSVLRTVRAARAAGTAGTVDARSLVRPFAGLALAAAVAVPVLLLVYVPALRGMSRDEAARSARLFMEGRFVPPATAARIESVSRVVPPAGHFLAGLAGVASQNRAGGGVNFLRGKVSVEGFPSYFAIAFGVKSPLGLLGLLGAGAVAAVLLFRGRRAKGAGLLAGACVLVAAGLFLAASGASYNIGVRHVLPAVPLLVVASVVAVFRAFGPARSAAVLLPLVLLEAVETYRVHPHELSFFNALAGGPGNGAAWLSDSNLDWGQDLRRLAALPLGVRQDELTVSYFGGDSPAVRLPRARLYDPVAAGLASAPSESVPPGLYAVSSFLLQCGPEFLAVKGNAAASEGYARLRRAVLTRGEPAGRVGYSIGLYRIREEGSPAR